MGNPLDDALDSIVDGRDIDWDYLGQEVPPAERDTLLRLKEIAAVQEAHVNPATGRRPLPFDWGPLHVHEWIARGAHGDVYRAWDPRLERDVALKLLHTCGEQDAAAIREGRLLARVRHPGVITVYGADRIDGESGIWMEFVRGRTLRAEVDEEGPLDGPTAARIGVEVCRGLAALHAAGLVHRDLNAHNVMRDDSGRIILMDLGSGTDAIHYGGFAGSPLYLAPEVLAGGRATAASDIYSAGVLLFFLVAGRYPVEAEGLDELRARALAGEVERLAPEPRVDAKFCLVVNRALARDPSARFATAADMAAALDVLPRDGRRGRARRWLAVTMTAAATAGVVTFTAMHREKPAEPRSPAASPRAVLIAPFINATRNAQFDGTVDAALAYALGDSRSFTVVPRDRIVDTLALMRRPKSTVLTPSLAREVALRDGAIALVVDGTVRSAGPQTIIRAELTDVGSGRTVAILEEQAADAAAVPLAIRRLAVRVRTAAGEASADLHESLQQLERVTTPSLPALKMYSEARTLFDRGDDAAAEAVLTGAVEADPDFASAQIWLAWAELNLGRPSTVYMPHARRAFELAPLASAHERYFIVSSYEQMSGHYDEAMPQLEALVRDYPGDAWGVRNLAHLYDLEGRPAAAALLLQRLAALRPNDFYTVTLAAQYATEFLGTEAANSAVVRPRELIDREPAAIKVFEAPRTWVRLYPFHDAWLRGDLARADAVLQTVSRTQDFRDEGDNGALFVGASELTLGRLDAAERVFETMAGGSYGTLWMSVVELARGNIERARTLAREYRDPDIAGVSLLVRLGALDDAQRQLARIENDDPIGSTLPAGARVHRQWAHEEIALAQHDAVALDAAKRQGLPWLEVMSGVRSFMYSETLAEALRYAGDLPGATRVLQESSDNLKPRLFTRTSHNGYFWMRLRKLLADVYREQGRIADARGVEQELLDYLARADADNPLLVEMQRRAGRTP